MPTCLRRLVTTAVAVLAALSVAAPASGHDIALWWRYDPSYWKHDFRRHDDLRALHASWHDAHRFPGGPARRERWRRRHERFHHLGLDHAHQDLHRHAIAGRERGEATWYDLDGTTGACGAPLRGLYAAHPQWPCGTLVSVRAGDRYVFVTVADRGPQGDGRVIDLSRRAFERLARQSAGVLDVRIYRLDGVNGP